MWLVMGFKRKQGSVAFLCMYEVGKVKESTPKRGLESWVLRLRSWCGSNWATRDYDGFSGNLLLFKPKTFSYCLTSPPSPFFPLYFKTKHAKICWCQLKCPSTKLQLESVSKFEAAATGGYERRRLSETSDAGATAPDATTGAPSKILSLCLPRQKVEQSTLGVIKSWAKQDVSFCDTVFQTTCLRKEQSLPEGLQKVLQQGFAWALSTSAPLHWDPSPNDPLLSSSSACLSFSFRPRISFILFPSKNQVTLPSPTFPLLIPLPNRSSFQDSNNTTHPGTYLLFPIPSPARRCGIFVQRL